MSTFKYCSHARIWNFFWRKKCFIDKFFYFRTYCQHNERTFLTVLVKKGIVKRKRGHGRKRLDHTILNQRKIVRRVKMGRYGQKGRQFKIQDTIERKIGKIGEQRWQRKKKICQKMKKNGVGKNTEEQRKKKRNRVEREEQFFEKKRQQKM